MAKFCENGQEWESFVWKPRKPSCLRKDGSCDYEKLNQLITKAQQGDQEAKMLVFEQYAGVWQSLCSQSEEIMYRLAMDYEDFQSEAFCCYLKTLKYFENSNFENIKEYFVTNFKNKILNLFRDIERQVTGHGILSNMNKKDQERRFSYSIHSLQERNEEGNLKYDLPDTDAENEYFQDYYPRIKKLLTEQELQVIVYHYVEGFSIKATSKKFGISSRTMDNIIKSTKEKLKVLNK